MGGREKDAREEDVRLSVPEGWELHKGLLCTHCGQGEKMIVTKDKKTEKCLVCGAMEKL